jgi:hypothetical protein
VINIEINPILNGGDGLKTKSIFFIESPIISDKKCQ